MTLLRPSSDRQHTSPVPRLVIGSGGAVVLCLLVWFGSWAIAPATELGQHLPFTAEATIAGQVIQLEVAQTSQQQATGLMHRRNLPTNQGMLFPFQPPQAVSFWMKNTLIALDMVFLRQGRVVMIHAQVPPCRQVRCPTYGTSQLVDQVLELRGGRTAELGLKVGDRVSIRETSISTPNQPVQPSTPVVQGSEPSLDPAQPQSRINQTTAANQNSSSPARANTPVIQEPSRRPAPANVYKIANETTVLIQGQSPGSGVIIAKLANTYYVLTAKHVVATEDEYAIVTADAQQHSVDNRKLQKLPNTDLAVLQFNSDQSYPTARLGNSDQVQQGAKVYVSGWPIPGEAITKSTHLVTEGNIVGFQKGEPEGYELLYGNSTAPGMSGGPVFDQGGRVVGIHRRAEGNRESGKVGINLGIPINIFVRQAPKAGLSIEKLGLQIQQ